MIPLVFGRSLVKEIARGLAERGLASEVIATHACAPNGCCVPCREPWPCPMRLRGEEARVVQLRAEARVAASRRTRSAPPRVPPVLRSAAE
jgi:hypothetical protein